MKADFCLCSQMMNLTPPAPPIKPPPYTKGPGRRPSERPVQQGEKAKVISIQASRAPIGLASPGVICEMKGNLTPRTSARRNLEDGGQAFKQEVEVEQWMAALQAPEGTRCTCLDTEACRDSGRPDPNPREMGGGQSKGPDWRSWP